MRSAVYGDLTGRLVGWGMRWPVSLAVDRRSRWRVCHRGSGRRRDFGMIDGVARASGGAEATSVRRRKRGSPAGGQWDKALTGVMVSRF